MLATARNALREATAASHQRLHHLPSFASLAAGRLDRPGYVRLLERLLGFHAPIEATIASALADENFGLDLSRCRRSHLLVQDLRVLGAGDSCSPPSRPMVDRPALTSAAEAMGWLYVVEGSALGGRLLARHLDHVLPPHDASGRLFLLAGGDSAHISWREVCQAVDVCGLEPERLKTMIAGALGAFDCFGSWFAEGDDRFAA
jgi:heme oxygenase